MTGTPARGTVGRTPLQRATDWFRAHRQRLFNVYLFAVFSGWVGWQTWRTWSEGRLDCVETSFAVQNMILVALLLLRNPHKAIDRSPLHQIVALVAFCSGAAFMGQPPTGSALAATVSRVIILCANVLGAACLLNLGRSFGILIALREVKTDGLYSLVRHPMYGTDILLRIGFIVSHLSWRTATLFVLSTGCYVYRAILEERFLSQDRAYREYMIRVPYRFLPGVY